MRSQKSCAKCFFLPLIALLVANTEAGAALPTPTEQAPLVFNFGPAGLDLPAEVIQTGNARFDPARGWGWVRPASALRQRNRNDDPMRDTFAAVPPAQAGGAEFAVSLPNGRYVVEVMIGDPQFAAASAVFVQNDSEPFGGGQRIPDGMFHVERREVVLDNARLSLSLPTPPSQGAPFSSIARLRIFPAGTTLEIDEQDRMPERLPVRRQAELPETPVAYTPGTMVPLSSIVRSASEVYLLSDPDRPGMWCWFQDPRVIVDSNSPKGTMLLAGVVTYGDPGTDQRGDIDLYWANLDSIGSGQFQRGRFELEDRLQMDDHCSPGLMIRPDGRYLATWSMHGEHGSPRFAVGSGESRFMRWRVSAHPGDPTEWQPMQRAAITGQSLCYTHPLFLSEGYKGGPIVFNAIRSTGFDNHVIRSHDLGDTWTYGGRLIDTPDPWPHHGNGGRGYVKYAGDGISRVYIILTDDHPDVNFNEDRTAPGPLLNSVYAGYIENNRLYDMDGRVLDSDLGDRIATPPNQLTVLLKDGTQVGDAVMRRGWQSDIRVMPDGKPVAIFQFRADDDKDDHRYFYARHDGERFNVHFLAYAGSYFGRHDQPDYAGLATVDAMNPDIVYISTSAHPVTGEVLISSATGKRQFEIFMGRTRDQGATWEWSALTENSPYDNIRPFSPAWEQGRSAVVYMSGNYPSFYVYDNEVRLRVFELK